MEVFFGFGGDGQGFCGRSPSLAGRDRLCFDRSTRGVLRRRARLGDDAATPAARG